MTTPVIKWGSVLVLAAITIVTVITIIIMLNRKTELQEGIKKMLEEVPEDRNLTEKTLESHYDSVNVWKKYFFFKYLFKILLK